jgi:hypothetical protein
MKMVDQMDKEVRALKKDLLSLCWYMRGGLQYADALDLCHEERTIIGEIIKDNLETTKKSKMPFF